jgi:hypothetical protein
MQIKDLYQKKIQTFNSHVALERVSNAMQQVTHLVSKTSCGKFHFQLQPKDVANQLSRICQ